MSFNSETVPVYNDGLIKPPSDRYPELFPAMCETEVRADGIDIADINGRAPDGVINAAFATFLQQHPNGYTKAELTAFAENHVCFPDRTPRVHDVFEGETLPKFTVRLLKAGFRSAGKQTTSQMGNPHPAYESGGRFSATSENEARIYNWDQLNPCVAGMRALGAWGIRATESVLHHFRYAMDKNEDRISNVNAAWGASRNQPPVMIRIGRNHAIHKYPMSTDLEGEARATMQRLVEQARAKEEII